MKQFDNLTKYLRIKYHTDYSIENYNHSRAFELSMSDNLFIDYFQISGCYRAIQIKLQSNLPHVFNNPTDWM